MGLIACEICYAEEQDIFVKKLQLPDGASVKVALQKACLGHLIAGIEAGVLKIGTYSKPRILGDVIAAGDRIEIYRPLRADPKLVRKCKVEKQRTENPDRWIRR
nr:RnfH family protein [Derxia gummosa]